MGCPLVSLSNLTAGIEMSVDVLNSCEPLITDRRQFRRVNKKLSLAEGSRQIRPSVRYRLLKHHFTSPTFLFASQDIRSRHPSEYATFPPTFPSPTSTSSRSHISQTVETDKMASNPPGSCCYKGVKHEGEPTGDFSQLGDFEIYTKYPDDKSTEHGILM